MNSENSTPSENEKINIWSQEAAQQQVDDERKLARKPTKPRWGIRHAVYAFLVSLVLQSVVTIPFLIIETANLASKGTLDPAKYQAQVTASLLSGPGLFFAQISMYVAWFGVGIYVTYRLGLHSFIKDFWFRFKWVQDISLGILLAVSLRILEAISFWIFGLLGLNLAGADNSTPFTQSSGIWSGLLLFGVVSIVGPISEEFLFRGLLTGAYQNFPQKDFLTSNRVRCNHSKDITQNFCWFREI